MVHYAGYTPRFHPSDFRTRTVDGVGADWPIRYEDLRPHYETVEREFPPFRVVWLGTNLGAGGARNAGLREANNDRILFIDNDVALTDRCITR